MLVDLKKSPLEWRFFKYYRTMGYLVEVEPKRREAVVFLPDKKVTFISDVSSYVNIENLRTEKLYRLDFAIYVSKLNNFFKCILLNRLREPYLSKKPYTRLYYLSQLQPLEDLVQSIDTVYRFELLKAIYYYPSKTVRDRYLDIVLNLPPSPTGFKWRHLLDL